MTIIDHATRNELAALEEIEKAGKWHVGGHDVSVTNLEKILFPATETSRELTKRDLIRYYATIAPTLLPYLKDRPLNTHRFPGGINASSFWQKKVPDNAPEWMQQWRYPGARKGKVEMLLVADSVASLVWLANYGAIEIHPWTSQTNDANQPTYALIDIDPGTATTFDDVRRLTHLYKDRLDSLGMRAYPKTTGKRGLQIWIPVRPGYLFEDTRGWIETLSHQIADQASELVSWKWELSEREGKARLDFTQNGISRTLVGPYVVRPAPGAPVSAPISWGEVSDPDLRPNKWTILNMDERLKSVGDLFAGVLQFDQELPEL